MCPNPTRFSWFARSALAVAALLAVRAGIVVTQAAGDPPAPRVFNTEPTGPPVSVRLEEIWRIGAGAGDPVLGTITQAAADAAGNVYLLDTQLCHAVAISPEGRYIRTLGGEGDGPGENRRPRDIVLLADGNLGLLEMFPAKIVRLTLAGEPRGSLVIGGSQAPAGGFVAASRCILRGGTFLVAGQTTEQSATGQRRVLFLSRLGDSGEEQVRYREAVMTLDFQKLRFIERELEPPFHLAMAVGPDGRVYAPESWEKYAIEVFRPDGPLDRVIERKFENRKRTEEELRRVNAVFDASQRSTPIQSEREVEPCPPAIVQLHVDAQGNLWVLHSRSDEHLPAGAMQSYDVYDPKGRYLHEVHVRCEGDPATDGLEFLPDGRVLLIKGYVLAGMARTDLGNVPLGEEEAPAPLEVICCRMLD